MLCRRAASCAVPWRARSPRSSSSKRPWHARSRRNSSSKRPWHARPPPNKDRARLLPESLSWSRSARRRARKPARYARNLTQSPHREAGRLRAACGRRPNCCAVRATSSARAPSRPRCPHGRLRHPRCCWRPLRRSLPIRRSPDRRPPSRRYRRRRLVSLVCCSPRANRAHRAASIAAGATRHGPRPPAGMRAASLPTRSTRTICATLIW